MAWDFKNERRLFERVDANRMEIGWHLQVTQNDLHERKVSGGSRAQLLDVSVGSARILTYYEPALPVGSEVIIGSGEGLGLVRIMSVSREPNASSMEVGVDYIDLEQSLQDYLMEPIRAAHHAQRGEVWQADR